MMQRTTGAERESDARHSFSGYVEGRERALVVVVVVAGDVWQVEGVEGGERWAWHRKVTRQGDKAG